MIKIVEHFINIHNWKLQISDFLNWNTHQRFGGKSVGTKLHYFNYQFNFWKRLLIILLLNEL